MGHQLFIVLLFCFGAISAFGQNDDPFSIRVESNEVLVRAEVYVKGSRYLPAGDYYHKCMISNWYLSLGLSMSEPYLADADCLKGIEITNLQPKEFHVFEDGVEQKISNVALEHVPWTLERDMHSERLTSHIPSNDFVEFHRIWSYTPRGIWRSSDLPSSSRFSGSSVYRISYVPRNLVPGSCHRVNVSVERHRAEIVATDHYCYIPHDPTDALEGTELGKSMEAELGSHFVDPVIPLVVQAGFFYTDGHVKVEIVSKFPFEKLRHNWRQGNLKGNIGVLGVLYAHGKEVTRFSDAAIVRGDLYWSDELDGKSSLPSRYETQFDLPGAGEYELRTALSDGSSFGRAVVPIHVEERNDNAPILSSLFLFKRFRNAGVAEQEAKRINLAPAYVPLVSQELNITPTADPTFHAKQTIPVYFEVYEPAGQKSEPIVQVHMRIVEEKTGEAKQTFPWFESEPYRRPGTNTFAIHTFLYSGELLPGNYRLEAQAKDSLGRSSKWQGAEFTIR